MPFVCLGGTSTTRISCAVRAGQKDRVARVREARKPKQEPEEAFRISEDSWDVGIGTDIALWTEKNMWLCRVLRMRIKKGKRWVEYTKPVCIHEDRTALEGLYVTCYFYKRVHGGKRKEERYRLDHADWDEYPIASVSCRVALTYTEGATRGLSYYALAPETQEILRAQKKGLPTYDYSAKRRKSTQPTQLQ